MSFQKFIRILKFFGGALFTIMDIGFDVRLAYEYWNNSMTPEKNLSTNNQDDLSEASQQRRILMAETMGPYLKNKAKNLPIKAANRRRKKVVNAKRKNESCGQVDRGIQPPSTPQPQPSHTSI